MFDLPVASVMLEGGDMLGFLIEEGGGGSISDVSSFSSSSGGGVVEMSIASSLPAISDSG